MMGEKSASVILPAQVNAKTRKEEQNKLFRKSIKKQAEENTN